VAAASGAAGLGGGVVWANAFGAPTEKRTTWAANKPILVCDFTDTPIVTRAGTLNGISQERPQTLGD